MYDVTTSLLTNMSYCLFLLLIYYIYALTTTIYEARSYATIGGMW